VTCLFLFSKPREAEYIYTYIYIYLDRGLDTKHVLFCYPEDDRALAPSSLTLFWFQISFFRKNQRYRNSSPCFLIFKIKETKDSVTSPRAWTCDFLPPFYVISLAFMMTSVVYYFCMLTVKHRVWIMNYLRNRIHFASFTLHVHDESIGHEDFYTVRFVILVFYTTTAIHSF